MKTNEQLRTLKKPAQTYSRSGDTELIGDLPHPWLFDESVPEDEHGSCKARVQRFL